MAYKDPEKRRAKRREYYAKNKEKVKAYAKKWQKANPDKFYAACKAWRLQAFFKLSAAEYTRLSQAQGGTCAICKGLNKSGKALCVDHSHKTGRVRGLLCARCNVALGYCDDSPERLRAAAEYLERT